MKTVLLFVFCCGILLAVPGCFFGGPDRETRVFDLAETAGKKMDLPCGVHFLFFRNLSGSDRRFLLRMPDGRVVSDEFSRWLLDPELMLERFLRDRIRSEGPSPIRVRGVITRFELDLKRHKALLAADFELRSDDKTVQVSCRSEKDFRTEPFDAAEAAKAMGQCAEETVLQLGGRIRAFAAKKPEK